ncbi:MAG: glycosyltransferase family A protein [Nitrospira sp.]|nr:glycosyltransferase family A protein [Nitrospira sp.]
MKTILQRGREAIDIIRKDGCSAFFERLEMFVDYRMHKISKAMQQIQCRYKQQEEWPTEKPLISVIIPCYNYGIFIKGAIESVLAQTFQRFEILVINDGSTDDLTTDILQNLRYEKTTIIHQANQGLAQTRNNGAALAAGKYICYLDPDDFFDSTYLEKTLPLLETDESLGSCYSWVRCFGDFESIWETDDLDPFLLRQRCIAPSQSVIRTEAWRKVKERNGSGFLSRYNGYFEDWVFWIDMVQCGYRGQVIREPLIRYRVHKTSLGATHKPGRKKMLPVLHDDRREFFFDRSYQKQLEQVLNKRIYIENNRINLSSSSFSRSGNILS